MSELSGRYPLADLLECADLARSSYYYALSHPKAPTRPELWEAAAEIFSRTANGCGHRQIAMCLRAEQGAVIADKTVLKMMREMGIRCGIRRETDYHRYNSYKGEVGETFENVIGRDFAADGPWEKMGTDVTEFKQPWGKAYFAPVYDFGSKEVVAWSTSRRLVDVAAPQHGPAARAARPAAFQEAGGLCPNTAFRYGLAIPAGRVVQQAEGGRHRAEHVQEGQLHRQRRDGAGVRPYKRRVLPWKEVALLRRLQEGPGRLHHPLEHEEEAG